MLLTAATVIAHDGLLQPGWIQIDGDRVTAAGAGAPPRPLNPDLGDQDLGDRIVVPGFVDMHGHGGGGGAFPTGDADQARAAVDLHRRHGTTTSIASLVTAGPADRLRIVGVMAELTDEGLIAGTHLEDPWLSNERPCHTNNRSCATPARPSWTGCSNAGRGTIRMVTLAPERTGTRRGVEGGRGRGSGGEGRGSPLRSAGPSRWAPRLPMIGIDRWAPGLTDAPRCARTVLGPEQWRA